MAHEAELARVAEAARAEAAARAAAASAVGDDMAALARQLSEERGRRDALEHAAAEAAEETARARREGVAARAAVSSAQRQLAELEHR